MDSLDVSRAGYWLSGMDYVCNVKAQPLPLPKRLVTRHGQGPHVKFTFPEEADLGPCFKQWPMPSAKRLKPPCAPKLSVWLPSLKHRH
eukprot:6403865-Amphidinium_carterae.2